MERTAAHFVAEVEKCLQRHDLLAVGDKVLVAVSGGPDSVALLHALGRLAASWRWEITVAHLHHGLRGAAADADALFVAELARRLGFPSVTERVDAAAEARREKISIETAGRRLRYAFLDRTADSVNARRVALGHQRNDNAELVLMNLMRGTGPLGLAAMPPLRGERYIRPLLEFDRSQILAFLKAIDAPYRQDETNRCIDHTRNWVRRVLLPMIGRQVNPAVVETLNRTAAILRDEETWLASLTETLLRPAVCDQCAGQIVLDAEALRTMAPAARRRVLRLALSHVHPDRHRIRWDHIEAIAALPETAAGPKRLHLPHRIEVTADQRRIIFRRSSARLRETPPRVQFRYEVTGPGRLNIPELGLTATISVHTAAHLDLGLIAGQWSAFFDMDVVGFPLVVRSPAPGDRFRPLGAGGTQRVSKFFIDHKVPPPLRPQHPVVESQGRIVWLAGQRIAQAVGAGESSRRVLAMVVRQTDAPDPHPHYDRRNPY